MDHHLYWVVRSALIKAVLLSQWDLVFWGRLKGQKRRNSLHVQCHCFRVAKSKMGITLPGFKRWIGEVTLNIEKGCTFLFFISSSLLFILLHSKLSIVISSVNKGGKKGTPSLLLKSWCFKSKLTVTVWGLHFAEVLCCSADHFCSWLSPLLLRQCLPQHIQQVLFLW